MSAKHVTSSGIGGLRFALSERVHVGVGAFCERAGLAIAFGLGASVIACDRGVPERPSDVGLSIVESSPDGSKEPVALNQAIRLRFDGWVLPQTVIRQSIVVSGGGVDPDSGLPKGGSPMFEPIYDPYERTVVFQFLPGGRWTPDTLHHLVIAPPKDEGAVAGFRRWDGAALGESLSVSFMTAKESSASDDRVQPLGFCGSEGVALPAPREVLARACARSGCHGGGAAVLGLDLSSGVGVKATAFGVVARQTENGATPGVVVANPKRFGDHMARIAPKDSGSSYLIYKLLVHPQNYEVDVDEGPMDGGQGNLSPVRPPSELDRQRLTQGLVRGAPMPADGFLHPDEMRALVRWINSGAPTTCP